MARTKREKQGRGGAPYTRYLELRRSGNTYEEIAAIIGCSVSTVNRTFKEMRAKGFVTEDELADYVTGEKRNFKRISAAMPLEEVRARVIEVFNDEMEKGGPSAIRAAVEVMDVFSRAQAATRYADIRDAERRVVVRQTAARMGRELRVRAETDKRLHELYYKAASAQATERDREILRNWVENHHADVFEIQHDIEEKTNDNKE